MSGHGAPAGVDFELVMGWWRRECGARQFAACPDSARCSPPQSRPDTCSGNSVRKVGEGGAVGSPLEPQGEGEREERATGRVGATRTVSHPCCPGAPLHAHTPSPSPWLMAGASDPHPGLLRSQPFLWSPVKVLGAGAPDEAFPGGSWASGLCRGSSSSPMSPLPPPARVPGPGGGGTARDARVKVRPG